MCRYQALSVNSERELMQSFVRFDQLGHFNNLSLQADKMRQQHMKQLFAADSLAKDKSRFS